LRVFPDFLLFVSFADQQGKDKENRRERRARKLANREIHSSGWWVSAAMSL
jgi:hypothetical protein